MEIPEENKIRFLKMLSILVIILVAYFAVKIISEIKKDSMLGESSTPATISFSGHGEVTAVPDIASVYFTISKDAKTTKDAQAGVATIEKAALNFLKTKGVADADIKTTDASSYPKYEYQNAVCPQNYGATNGTVSSGGIAMPIYCPPGKSVLIGYTASESITVKVRNTDTVGDIMQGLGTTGVTNLSGPNFSIDNPDAVQAQARKKAIDDAKSKAEILAKDLGVSLGKITSFSEGGNYNSYPVMYDKAMNAGTTSAPAPAVLPKGENTITSDVTITYEIR